MIGLVMWTWGISNTNKRAPRDCHLGGSGEGHMSNSIIGHNSDQDNIYAGIPCFDAGETYPGWCPGCTEEAESRELIAMRYQCSAHAVCDHRDPPSDYDNLGGQLYPDEFIDRLALHHACRDTVRPANQRMVRR